MKKYLMIGASALAVGAVFTSCGHDEPNVGDVYQETYAQKFIEVFGQPAASQDWGFSSAAQARMTRANAGVDYPATEQNENANANEWADPNKYFGGWLVPDPLTEGQKERVKAYFQANPNPDYQDPHFRHFFVQQVYKGKTAVGANSPETITAANGSVYSSDNMNLLTVGQANIHINNFNAGNCTVNNTVLTNGGNANDGPFHSDQISLMVNIDDTSCFGYHETGSSTHHNDKAGLVSAATIDAWAAQNGNPGEAVVDKWNRSFMGFDLAIKEGTQACETDASGNIVYATYNQAAESPVKAWDGEKIIDIATYDANWQLVYNEGYQNIFGCGWLTTNENFYVAADKVTMSQTVSMNRAQASTITSIVEGAPVLKDIMEGDNYYQSVINLPRIKQLVDDGYLPVNNKNLTEWVKVGKSDGYYSDWIVTLTEGKRSGSDDIVTPVGPTKKSIRIMAEDLSASEASDFDFNDVVFDVEATYPENVTSVNQVKVTVWAAGGTLPLKINSVGGNGGFEVHQAMGISEVKTMTNTHAEPYAGTFDGITYYWIDDVAAYTVETLTLANNATISVDNFEADVNNALRVEVEKGGVWMLLTAQRGYPACKIGVPVGTPWAMEKRNMNNAFTSFRSWVTTGAPAAWYNSKVVSQIYNDGTTIKYGLFGE